MRARLTQEEITSKVILATLEAAIIHPRDGVKALTVFIQKLNEAGLYVDQRP